MPRPRLFFFAVLGVDNCLCCLPGYAPSEVNRIQVEVVVCSSAKHDQAKQIALHRYRRYEH